MEFRHGITDGGPSPDVGEWEVKLCNGGLVTVKDGERDINVRPVYPQVAKERSLLETVKQLKIQILGRIAPVRHFLVDSPLTSKEKSRHQISWKQCDPKATLCKNYARGYCGPAEGCQYNHGLLDFTDVEVVLRRINRQATSVSRPRSIKIAFVKFMKYRHAEVVWRITARNGEGRAMNVTERDDLWVVLWNIGHEQRLEACLAELVSAPVSCLPSIPRMMISAH